ncbi:hypothetical protein BH10PSE13_BH10PSE13_25940 [soil metagenome]
MAENWIRTDETQDVAGSIRHAIRIAQFVGEDSQAWKWVALALHSALQGACVCHLTTTAPPVGAVEMRNAGEWLAHFEELRTNLMAKSPKTRLMNLPDLLGAVRRPHSAGDHSNAVGIAISDAELRWLRRFHEDIRNQFTHFEPLGWSIEVSGIPKIATLVTRIIGETLHTGWAFRHQDDQWRQELHRNLQILASLKWLS